MRALNMEKVRAVRELIGLLTVIFTIAFLLHFVWEMWQIPFYLEMADAKHSDVVGLCTRATVGDAVMATIAYIMGALIARRADWLLVPKAGPLFMYFATGLVLTMILEYRATEIADRWQYSELMPRLPFLNTGLIPLLQWVLLPMGTLFFSQVFWRGLRRRR